MDGLGVVVGDVLVDDLHAVGREELLNVSQACRTIVWVHYNQLNILKHNTTPMPQLQHLELPAPDCGDGFKEPPG